MDKILILIGILVLYGILWSLPLYLVVNFVCWVFHLTFHLSLLQAFAVTLLGSVIHNILFKNKEG